MAKSKKKSKTAAQQVMGVASTTMPSPVRGIVTSRWGAPVFLVVAAALIASGIVTLQWSNGRPHVKVDRERATEVEHKLEERVEQFEGNHADKGRITERFKFGKKQR